MNLKLVHAVFVAAVAALCFLFGGWLLGSGAGDGRQAGAGLCFALGVAAVAYGFWFWRRVRTPEEERRRRLGRIHRVGLVLALLWLGGDRAALACEVCYGNAGGPMIDAARAGVFLLWGLVLLMQVALAIFFLVLRKRAATRSERVPPWWSTVEEPIDR